MYPLKQWQFSFSTIKLYLSGWLAQQLDSIQLRLHRLPIGQVLVVGSTVLRLQRSKYNGHVHSHRQSFQAQNCTSRARARAWVQDCWGLKRGCNCLHLPNKRRRATQLQESGECLCLCILLYFLHILAAASTAAELAFSSCQLEGRCFQPLLSAVAFSRCFQPL